MFSSAFTFLSQPSSPGTLFFDLYPDDQFSGYSTARKLRTGYSGAAFQILAFDGTYTNTLDVGYDSNNEVDTAAIASFCGGLTGYVQKIYDNSTLGNHLSLASPTTNLGAPIYFPSTGVTGINGKPAIRFNDIAAANGKYFLNTSQSFTEDISVISLQQVDVTGIEEIFGLSQTGTGLARNNIAVGNTIISSAYNSNLNVTSITPYLGTPYIHTSVFLNSADQIWGYVNDNVSANASTVVNDLTNPQIFLGDYSTNNTLTGFIQEAFIFTGDKRSLKSDMVTNIQTFYNISTYDPDAQAFFDAITTAGGTLTTTEKDAVNDLVVGLKADSIWADLHCVYPLVGGTETSTSFNLIDPTQFTVNWVNPGLVDFSNGFRSLTTTLAQKTYGNSNFNISDFTQYQSGIGYYINNFAYPSGGGYNTSQDIGAMGAISSSSLNTPNLAFFKDFGNFTQFNAIWGTGGGGGNRIVTDQGTFNGFWSLTANGTSTANFYYNGANVGSLAETFTFQGTSNDIFLGSFSYTNSNGPYNNFFGNFGLFYIDKGLSSTQISNLYTRVTTYATALGR